MADRIDGRSGEPLSERVLDLLVFVPAGIVVSVVEELPKLAERGRSRLGVKVSSARSVGHFAFEAGHRELRRRTRQLHGGSGEPSAPTADPERGRYPIRTIPRNPPRAGTPAPAAPGPPAAPATGGSTSRANGHVPEVASLAIPGFDTLSASQVVQRLDGLSRTELVSVRAYETATRGRRTILNRVDQLLDERS